MYQLKQGRQPIKAGNWLLAPLVSSSILLTPMAMAEENTEEQAPPASITLPEQSIVGMQTEAPSLMDISSESKETLALYGCDPDKPSFARACLLARRMIERGEIEYALVVDGETANLAYKKTLERLSGPDVTEEQFRNELATLTLGCGAAAMVLSRSELTPDAPKYKGGVTKAATQWNTLCRGNLDRMVTDTRMLLIEGLKLATATFGAARQALGWVVDELDEFVIHQVSQVHTQAFVKAFGLDPAKVMTIFNEHGNIGPASVPIVLSKLKEMGRLKKGDRVALLGIGSGLNCSMAEVVW